MKYDVRFDEKVTVDLRLDEAIVLLAYLVRESGVADRRVLKGHTIIRRNFTACKLYCRNCSGLWFTLVPNASEGLRTRRERV